MADAPTDPYAAFDALRFDRPAPGVPWREAIRRRCLSLHEAMLRHPACENAVATALLDLCGAVEAFGPQAARFARQRARCYNLVRVIVERDFTVGYPARGLGDPDWLNRSALVTEIQTIAQAVPESDTAALPVPVDLLTTVPFGPPAHDRYRVDGSGVYRLG